MKKANATTKQEEEFCVHYVTYGVANRAYNHAYPDHTCSTDASVRVIACNLLKKPHIAERVKALRESMQEDSEALVVRIKRERERLAFFDPRKFYDDQGNLLPLHKLDDDSASAIAGMEVVEMQGGAEIGGAEGVKHIAMYTKKIKLADKNASLTALEKMAGLYKDEGPTNSVFNITINLL